MINPEPEPDDDDDAADDGSDRSLLSEDDVSRGNVEDRRQGSADVVEGDADVLEAQVVEGDHGHEDDG